ncbi:MAG: ABC transporter permease [Salinivirgaceae bacterium]|nr:ABC transporter permease [Salinivirgaceae bacterium]
MNYYLLKQVLRGIKQNRFNNVIKVLGIILALVPAILILSFVKHELSYDKQFKDSERVYRVIRNWQEDPKYGTYTAVPFLNLLMEKFSEIETGTRLWPLYDIELNYNNKIYHEEVALTVDSTFFKTFGIDLLQGNKKNALDAGESMIISLSMAKKLFENENAIGKQIQFEGYGFSDENRYLTVKGVFKDFPANSHLKGNIIIPIKNFRVVNTSNHTNHSLITYLKLKNPLFEETLESKLPEFMELFYGKEYYDYSKSTYLLQPITDIHLNTAVNYSGYETLNGSYASVYIFPALSLLIMLIALFNFVNLTVSEGKSKHKTFGINKISGANRYYFFKYYLVESMVLSIIGSFFTLILINLLSPIFVTFIERPLDLSLSGNMYWIWIIVAFIFLISIVNSIYPATVFSSKNLISYLKINNTKPTKNNYVQRVFQVLQFAICIFFIAGSIVVFKQLNFINSSINSGLKKENVLLINNAIKLGVNRSVFKSELKKLSEVSDLSLCNEVPGNGSYSHYGYPVDSAKINAHLAEYCCDVDYLSTLKMQLLKGRFFDSEHPTDNVAIVLNETAVRTLGWEKNPIGKHYKLGTIRNVIGVVKDIHFESLHEQIMAQGFVLEPENRCSNILIRATKGFSPELINQINQLWSGFSPDRKMDYNFLNDEFDFWYKTEQRTGIISIVLAVIAIFLSGLGLLALVLQSINAHIKEIGIRKVNGAKTYEIMQLLNTVFVKLVILASIIIIPFSYWLLGKWLENFAYKTELNWWVFLIAALATLIVALLTVSWQTYRAARRNPIESLRYE